MDSKPEHIQWASQASQERIRTEKLEVVRQEDSLGEQKQAQNEGFWII